MTTEAEPTIRLALFGTKYQMIEYPVLLKLGDDDDDIENEKGPVSSSRGQVLQAMEEVAVEIFRMIDDVRGSPRKEWT